MKFQEKKKYFYCEGSQKLEETQEECLSFEIVNIQLDTVLGNMFLLPYSEQEAQSRWSPEVPSQVSDPLNQRSYLCSEHLKISFFVEKPLLALYLFTSWSHRRKVSHLDSVLGISFLNYLTNVRPRQKASYWFKNLLLDIKTEAEF